MNEPEHQHQAENDADSDSDIAQLWLAWVAIVGFVVEQPWCAHCVEAFLVWEGKYQKDYHRCARRRQPGRSIFERGDRSREKMSNDPPSWDLIPSAVAALDGDQFLALQGGEFVRMPRALSGGSPPAPAGPAPSISIVTVVASGALAVTLPAAPLWFALYINGLRQLSPDISVVGAVVTIDAAMNLVAGDVVAIEYTA